MSTLGIILFSCTWPPSKPPTDTTDPQRPGAETASAAPDCDAAAEVFLNEVSPANTAALVDVEGDAPDWIEIFNAGPDTVQLSGWSLSDDPEEPQKWVFPSLPLKSEAFLLVHASGKDRARVVGSWDTRIDQGHV